MVVVFVAIVLDLKKVLVIGVMRFVILESIYSLL